MTRVSVYSAALVAFLASSAMILASIATPNWISYAVTTAKGDTILKTIGLHKSCSTLGGHYACGPYPTPALCETGPRYFCSMWRTTGWLASFSVVLSLAGLVAFAVTLGGGKYKRESGWPFVAGLISSFSAVQLVIISIVAYLFDHDDQFIIPGWKLGVSWYLTLGGAVVGILTTVGLAMSAYMLPPEDGYEFLDGAVDA